MLAWGHTVSGRKTEGSLTDHEKRIVKALISRGKRNQDIQALINERRGATVNGARISEVKKDDRIVSASEEEVDFYLLKKRSYDPTTGLNFFDDERLIRAREAMILAVNIFNSPLLKFKTEVFSLLANVAWTYLLHEHYDRRGVIILGDDGRSLLLSQMLRRSDCPLKKGVVRNLDAIKEIRDQVEHKLLGAADHKWVSLFQACCLNFENALCNLFSGELSLRSNLAFALQFAKLNLEQVNEVQKHSIPPHILALDARLNEGLTDADINDLEYQFRVVYTLDASSKSRAHFHFIHPGSDEANEIRNVLVKHRLADEDYPHKPKGAASLIAERSGRVFTVNNHTQAYKKYKVRPKNGARDPLETNKDYCVYHLAHKDYTYSNKWVDFIVEKIKSDEEYASICSFKQ